jgi:hypothetical protein
MLSLFPEVLFLAPFSAFIIRIAAAFVFGHAAMRHCAEPGMSVRAFGVIEGVCALMFLLGLYVQAAALLGVLLFCTYILAPRFRALPTSTLWLLFVLCLSLLVTGPGPFAFDLPL